MSRQLLEIETVLQSLVAEHRTLLASLDAQQAAMRKMDVEGLERATLAQESSRLRIAALDARRRGLTGQVAKALRVEERSLTLSKLAELHPARRAHLLGLRREMKEVVDQTRTRAQVAGRVATAILGHMNTVVRIVAGAVEKAGLYTKQGVPRVSARIGVMEAVG